MSQGLSVWIAVLSGVLGAALLRGVQTLVHTEPPTIATLNVRALIDAEIARAAKSKLSDAEAAEQVRAYGKQLSWATERLAKTRHLVILSESAVIAGAEDVTPWVREKLRHAE